MNIAEFRRRRATSAMRRAAKLLGRKRRGKSRDKWKGIGLAAAATAVGGAGILTLKKRKDGKSTAATYTPAKTPKAGAPDPDKPEWDKPRQKTKQKEKDGFDPEPDFGDDDNNRLSSMDSAKPRKAGSSKEIAALPPSRGTPRKAIERRRRQQRTQEPSAKNKRPKPVFIPKREIYRPEKDDTNDSFVATEGRRMVRGGMMEDSPDYDTDYARRNAAKSSARRLKKTNQKILGGATGAKKRDLKKDRRLEALIIERGKADNPPVRSEKAIERQRRQQRIQELSAKNKRKVKRAGNTSRVQARRDALSYNRKNSGLRNIRSLAKQATDPGISEAQRNKLRKRIERAKKNARQRFDTNRRSNPGFSLCLDLDRFATFSSVPALILDLDRVNHLYYGGSS